MKTAMFGFTQIAKALLHAGAKPDLQDKVSLLWHGLNVFGSVSQYKKEFMVKLYEFAPQSQCHSSDSHLRIDTETENFYIDKKELYMQYTFYIQANSVTYTCVQGCPHSYFLYRMGPQLSILPARMDMLQ